MLAAFLAVLFQLAVSPFNRIHRLMDEVAAGKVGRMADQEVAHGRSVEGKASPTQVK
jgi:hypothetical protein